MYTLQIGILGLLAGFFLVKDFELFRCKAFVFWLIISCLVGVSEFVWYLRFNAWVFDQSQVLGIKILGVELEDILFLPIFSVIFWKIYHVTEFRFIQRVFSPTDKLCFCILIFFLALNSYNIGSTFSQYMYLRLMLGLPGLIYVWNSSSFRHAMIFMLIVFCIAFFWDFWALSTGLWLYIPDLNNIPKIYDGMHFQILNARYPVEYFIYYISGSFMGFYFIALLKKYFSSQKKLS